MKHLKNILILSNSASGLYEFRNELIQNLLGQNEVYISLPEDGEDRYVMRFAKEGCHMIHTPFERRGMNPARDYGLYREYRRLMSEVRPDMVFTYTIKPNIYGGMAAKSLKIPYITNITGLGTAISGGGILSRVLLKMYAVAVSKADCIFFQNSSNMEYMVSRGIRGKGNLKLLPGSGVNLDAHPYIEYPSEDNGIEILSVMRIMKDKGIEELLKTIDRLGTPQAVATEGESSSADERVRRVHFSIAGTYEEESRALYEPEIERLKGEGKLTYLGFVDDMNPVYGRSHVIVHPSYHEGLSNVCLEAASCGRPVVTTDVPGCRETVCINEGEESEGQSGMLCQPKSADFLLETVEKMIGLSAGQRADMGRNGRRFVAENFDRSLVIRAYREQLDQSE